METYTDYKLKQLEREVVRYRNKYHDLCDWLERKHVKILDQYNDYQAVMGGEEDGSRD